MFTGLRDRLATLKNMDKNKKIAIAVILLFCLLVCGYFVGLVSGITGRDALQGNIRLGLGACMVRGFLRWSGLRSTLILFLVLTVILILVATRENVINQVRETDKRGVKYMEKGTFGTTRWMSSQEAAEAFEVSANPDTLTDFIYGKTRDTKETVAFKEKYKVDGEAGNRNRHNFVIGPSGSGKTFSIIKTALLQAIKRNESFIVTDPKGELAREYVTFCRENEMDTFVLNLMDPEYSDGWNCLREVISPRTERLDTKLLSEFVTCYLMNSSIFGKPGDEFWMAGAINILSAVIALHAWKRENFIIEGLIAATMSIYEGAGYTDPMSEIPSEILEDRMIAITRVKEEFKKVAEEYFFTEEEIRQRIMEIENAAPEFTIAAVYYYIVHLARGNYEEMATEIEALPQEHDGWISYSSFADSNMSDNVKTSTVNGVMLRLQLFKDKNLRKLLSCDGIHMRDINRRRTALFVVIPKDSDMLRPLLALLFKFMFQDAMETWDAYEGRCADEGTEVLEYLRPVNVIMEEAYSIGLIPGFPKYMSVVRSYRLDVTIIVQNITELVEIYGREGSSTIRAQCDTFLFLGCNDPDTAKDVSNFLLGNATVQSQSRRESTSLFIRGANEISVTESTRPLLTPAEARNYGGKHRIIVSTIGCHPLDLNQFPYTDHKMYRHLKSASFPTLLKPISQSFPQEDIFKRKEDFEKGLIKNSSGKEKSDLELLNDVLIWLRESSERNISRNSLDGAVIFTEATAAYKEQEPKELPSTVVQIKEEKTEMEQEKVPEEGADNSPKPKKAKKAPTRAEYTDNQNNGRKARSKQAKTTSKKKMVVNAAADSELLSD